MTTRKRDAARERSVEGSTERSNYAVKGKRGPAERQEVSPARNPTQTAPRYDPPPGWHAAELLDACLRARRRR